jgi:Domain of unknown function (DUF3943)
MLHAAVTCGLVAALGPLQPVAQLTEQAEEEDTFNWPRATRDLSVAMGLGVAWYVSQIEVNKRDFDFDRTFGDQFRRLAGGDGYRFDDNDRFLNVGHSGVGAYYHQLARVNGGSMAQAMLFDLVASSAWELTVEHREVFSVNDTITTTIGAVALGEGLFRLGDFFARSRPTVRNRLLMGVFSPARALTWLYGDDPRPGPAGFDARGLAADADHRLALSLGAVAPVDTTAGDEAGWHTSLRADLELVDLPTYGRVGQVRHGLSGGEMTRMGLSFAGGARDMQSLAVLARSSLWGHYRQDTIGAPGGLDGHGTFLGSSTAFELSFDDTGELTDFLMAVHLIGPSADVAFYRSGWRLRLAADLYPDFAMVRPLALDDAAQREEGVPGQSVVKHDYYYALGVTGAARAEVSYGRLRAGAAAEYSGFDAIEGLDRHQQAYTSPAGVRHEAIVDDPDMADRRLQLRLYTETPLPLADFSLGAGIEYLRRSGTAADASRERDETRVALHATYAL